MCFIRLGFNEVQGKSRGDAEKEIYLSQRPNERTFTRIDSF